MKELEHEVLINVQSFLIHSVTDRMRYVFVDVKSEMYFNVTVYYNIEPLALDDELMTDVCENIMTSSSSLIGYNYVKVIDPIICYSDIPKCGVPVFGKYDLRMHS